MDKASLAMDLVRSELKRSAARVTVTIECQQLHFTQQQQAPQDDNDSPNSFNLAPPRVQESQILTQEHGAELPYQPQQFRQGGGSPSRELQQHRLVRVELVSDNYHDVMTQTMLGVESDLKLCRQLLQQCKDSFSSLVSYYGENAQAFANDAVFWSDVTTFVDSFTACQKQLRKQMQVRQTLCPVLNRFG